MSDQTFNMNDISGQNVNVGGTQTINYFGTYPIEPAPQADPRSVFISYARADDEPFVRRLYDHLTAANFDVWFDREKMPNRGSTFLQEIRDAVDAADTLLLVVGPAALTSDYVRAEWQHALSTCTRVIPLLRLGEYSTIPAELAKLHAPDCRATRAEADAFAEVERLLTDAPGTLATLYGVPPTPAYYVERDLTASVREKLLADVNSPLVVTSQRGQTTTVHGLGGIGKTTLATALSRECNVRRAFPDGVFWLEMGKQPDLIARMSDIGAAFGDDPTQYRDRAGARQRLAAVLADKRALLVLDDVWNHDHAADFRVASDRCRLLVTTRQSGIATKLDVKGEQLSTLSADEGLTLIAERVNVPAADLPPECAEIVRIVGGHTLAVSLAAAQLADRGLDYAPRLLKRLQKGKYFDKTLRLDDDDKNLNLELCLRLSYDDLPDDLKRRFRALGVLALEGAFDEALAMALWGDDDEDDTDDALTDLTRAGLLRRAALTPHPSPAAGRGEPRYTQHGLLRAYARALLDDANETDAAFARYADHIIAFAEQFDDLPLEQWHTLEPDLPHVHHVGDELVARYNAATTPDDALQNRCLEFAGNTYVYIHHRPQAIQTDEGTSLLGLNWLETGLSVARHTLQRKAERLFLNQMGITYTLLGDKQQALNHYIQAVMIDEELGDDPASEAATLSNIGRLYDALGEQQTALTYYEPALALVQKIGDSYGEANILNNMGIVHAVLGAPQRALAYYQRALQLMREIGDKHGEAATLNNIGFLHAAIGERQEALVNYEQALPLRRAVGDIGGEATTLNNIGRVYAALGAMQHALSYYEQALPLQGKVGDRQSEAVTLNNMGTAYAALGETQQAISYYERALLLQQKLADKNGEATTLSNIGRIYGERQEWHKALFHYEQTVRIRQQMGDKQGEAITLNNIGGLHSASGNLQAALDSYLQALRIFEELALPEYIAGQCVNVGVIWAKTNNTNEAVRYFLRAIQLAEQFNLSFVSGDVSVADIRSYLAQLQSASAHTQAPPLINAINIFLNTSNWTEARQVYETHADLLTSPEAEQIFLQNIASADDEDWKRNLQAHLDRIRRAQADGLDAAFAEDAPPDTPVMDAIRAFLNTANWTEARQVYEAHADLLTSPEAEEIFLQNIASADDEDWKRNLQAHLDRIRRAQADGLDAAFTDDAPTPPTP